MMRHACGVLIHVFTIFLAPYFVHFCDSWIAYGRDSETCPAGCAAAAAAERAGPLVPLAGPARVALSACL